MFRGKVDGNLVADDAKTGQELWRFQTGWGISAPPIPVGTTLTWQNNGAVIHTATDQKRAWNTGDIKGAESDSVTFDQPGTYLYTCTPHPWMIGVITVQ